MSERPDEFVFGVESVLGMDTGKALVKVSFGDQTWVIETEKAIEMSYMLIECAHAAESDLILFNTVTDPPMGMDVASAAQLIKLVRDKR